MFRIKISFSVALVSILGFAALNQTSFLARAAATGDAPVVAVSPLTADLVPIIAPVDGFPATDSAENGSLALGVPGLLNKGISDVADSKGSYSLAFDPLALGPRWVAWHLDNEDLGKSGRSNNFRPDQTLPPALQVRPSDYRGSGYDRGHQCPSGDRTSNEETNSSTFLMSNMLPQSADLNRQVWRKFEEYLRSQIKDGANEIYIVSGGISTLGNIGKGGVILPPIDANAPAQTDADAQTVNTRGVNIPAKCWKVALILPVGANDLARINADTRVIAVEMPNVDSEATAKGDWRDFLTTADAIEAETGLDFFSRVPIEVQKIIEARVDSGRAKPQKKGEVALPDADEK